MAVVENASLSMKSGAVSAKPALTARGGPRTVGAAPCAAGEAAHDAVLERAMRLIDPEIARSFTPEQRRAVRTMLDLRFATEHLVDVRRGFSLAGRRYFLALLLGRERRRLSRGRASGLSGWLQDHALLLLASGGLLVIGFLLAALLRA